MRHLTYDKEMKLFKFAFDDNSQKFPTILALREKGDSTTFWANTIDSFDFPVFFNIYNLDDIIIDESGEYIKRAFGAVNSNSLKYALFNEHVNLANNEIEIVFNPPRKITYFVNFSNNFEFYSKIKSFKCPKTGSYSQNRLVDNEIIQKLILNKDQIIHILHHKNSNFQEVMNSKIEFGLDALNLENRIINHLVKENSLNVLTEIESSKDSSEIKKNLISCLKTSLDNEGSILTHKKISIKFYVNHPLVHPNGENKQEKILIANSNDLIKDGNLCISVERRVDEILEKSQDYLDLYVLVEEYLENDKELSSLNSKFSNNHLGQTCFMKSNSFYPELSNLYFRFSRDEVVQRTDSMLFPDEIKNIYISQKLKSLGKEFMERIGSLIDIFNIDKEFDLIMFSIEFKLRKSENNKDEKIKVIGDKTIVPIISRIEPINKNILFNFEENFYFNFAACIKLNSFLNYISKASYFYMFRGLTLCAISYYSQEDLFYEECRKNGIKFYIIEHHYDEEFTERFEKEYFIQADIFDLDKYEEESERLAKLLLDKDIHILINFHNDTFPFTQLLREKMRKKVSLLDQEKQKEILKNFNSYNFNSNCNYEKAEILINKKKVYKEINAKAEKKGIYSLGSNFEIIDDDNYLTYEVKCKKIMKIDNSSGKLSN